MNQTNYKLLIKELQNHFEECSTFFKSAKFFTENDKYLFYPQFVLALYYFSTELKRDLKEDDKSTHRLFIYEIERINKRSGEYHNQFNKLLDNKDLLNDLLIHSIKVLINNLQKFDKVTLKFTLRDFIFKVLEIDNSKSPDYINKLLVQLINPQKGETIFEPAVGMGNTLRAALEYNQEIKLLGVDKDSGIIDFANLNLFLSGYNNPDLKHSDFIDNSVPINPPVDIIVSQPTPNESFFNFPYLINDFSAGKAEEDVLSKLLLSIKPYTGRMAIVIPNSYLSKSDTLDFRRKIIDQDNLEAFIKLPGCALGSDHTPVSIIVVNNNKKTKKKNKVLFIDANSGITSEVIKGLVSFDGISLNEFIKEVLYIFTINKVKSKKIGLTIKSKKELINEKYQLIEGIKILSVGKTTDPEQLEPSIPLEQTSGALQICFPIDEFVRTMQAVTSKEDIKSEVERFVGLFLSESGNVSYQEVRNHSGTFDRTLKQDLDESKTHEIVHLTSNDKSVSGIIKIETDKSLSEQNIETISLYWNSLIEMSKQTLLMNENKKVVAGFSHTTKNFFSSMQSELDLLIGTHDEELKSYLKNHFIDTGEKIDLLTDSETSKDDLIIWNIIENYKKQISRIAKYYQAIEFSLRSGNSDFSEFELIDLLKSLPYKKDSLKINSTSEKIFVIGYLEKVKQAFTDLIHNAISYSDNNICQVDITVKGVWMQVLISNSVSEVVSENEYSIYGKTRIEKSKGELSSGIGLQTSFLALKESYCVVSLYSYESYVKNKSFIIKLLLPSKK